MTCMCIQSYLIFYFSLDLLCATQFMIISFSSVFISNLSLDDLYVMDYGRLLITMASTTLFILICSVFKNSWWLLDDSIRNKIDKFINISYLFSLYGRMSSSFNRWLSVYFRPLKIKASGYFD